MMRKIRAQKIDNKMSLYRNWKIEEEETKIRWDENERDLIKNEQTLYWEEATRKLESLQKKIFVFVEITTILEIGVNQIPLKK